MPTFHQKTCIMNIEDIRDYCLSKVDVEETLPFGPNVIVFKTNGKAFLLLPLDTEQVRFNVKCDPELAETLRETYDCVLPGYHMNKKHWNTVEIEGGIPAGELRRMIDHSFELVIRSLPKAARSNQRRQRASRSTR